MIRMIEMGPKIVFDYEQTSLYSFVFDLNWPNGIARFEFNAILVQVPESFNSGIVPFLSPGTGKKTA